MKYVVIAVVVVLLGGAGYWFYTNSMMSADGDMDDTSMIDTDDVEATDENVLSGVGRIEALLALGRDIRCDFTHTPEEGGQTDGVFYLSGENMRGEFTVNDQGETYNMNTLHDGEYVYTWGSSPEGEMAMKFPVTEADMEDGDDVDTDMDDPSAVVNEDVEYDCQAWSRDDSLFVPPSDVEFVDMAAMMENMMHGMGGGMMPQ